MRKVLRLLRKESTLITTKGCESNGYKGKTCVASENR